MFRLPGQARKRVALGVVNGIRPDEDATWDLSAAAWEKLMDSPDTTQQNQSYSSLFGCYRGRRLRVHRTAPAIGQHSREMLVVLGYSEQDIDRLNAERVAGGPPGPPMWRFHSPGGLRVATLRSRNPLRCSECRHRKHVRVAQLLVAAGSVGVADRGEPRRIPHSKATPWAFGVSRAPSVDDEADVPTGRQPRPRGSGGGSVSRRLSSPAVRRCARA